MAASEFLIEEGFAHLSETRLIGAGYLTESSDSPLLIRGESASLSLALAIISFITGRKISAKWVPSATLKKINDEWILDEVENLSEKLNSIPQESKIILSKQQKIPEEVFTKYKDKIIQCSTLKEVVLKIWPDFKFVKDLRKKRVESIKEAKAYFKWWLFLIYFLLFCLIMELGLLQEWLPCSQHPGISCPNGFLIPPLKVVILTMLSAFVFSTGYLCWIIRLISYPLSYNEHLYFKSIGLSFVLGFLVFVTILSFLPSQPIKYLTQSGILLSRDANVQVFKALFVLALEIIIFVIPSINALSWAYLYSKEKRLAALSSLLSSECKYPHPLLVCKNTNHILIVAALSIMMLGMLQWISWKDPNEIGFGDSVRAVHMIVQSILMVALAGTSWGVLREAEYKTRAIDKNNF